MDPKLEALLNAGFELTYGSEDLEIPFSVRADGQIATVKEALRAFGTDDVRATFGLSAMEATRPVKSVNDLTEDEMARVTIALEEGCIAEEKENGFGTRLACGDKTYSHQDIIDEVRRRTKFGLDTIQSMRRHNQLVEEAIRRGKVKRIDAAPPLEFPDL